MFSQMLPLRFEKMKKVWTSFFLPEFSIFSLPEVSKWCWTSSIMLGGKGTPHISVWDFLMTSSGLVSGPPTIDHFVWYSRPRSARRVLHWYFMIRNFLKKRDKRGGHECIRPCSHIEETFKNNAISKNYHAYGSMVEYIRSHTPPFCPPPFQKVSNHELCYLSFILHQKWTS